MRPSSLLAPLCAALVLLAPRGDAAVFVFDAVLEGAQENPPNASPGTGTARVTLDDNLLTMRVEAMFSGLTGTTAAAHIHCCAPAPNNVGVASQTPSFSGFPLGVTSGSFDQTFDMMLSSSYNSSFVVNNGGTTASAFTALKDGLLGELAYFNIHTDLFPGGEIRGQFSTSVPEPTTWGMMLMGFGLVGGAMRRRRTAGYYALPDS